MTTSTLGRLVLFLASATMAAALAQAQQPPQGAKAPSQAATASTPATSQPAQTTATDSKAKASESAKPAAPVQKAADSAAQLINDARNAGFKPETIRGSQMFCRTAVELGSNFPVRTCYDSDQVKIKIAEYREQRNQLEQMHSSGLQTQ